ncbi:proline--tRNA ligase [Candidatus Profftella armatura]|uniref:Proline--tRNA ligase n=1 Tax=Candidatus Profftella armatura TaxID=669502 RepID=S5RPE8_9PROT|nr:proline--tRNA ligase [Candidatus Profftella armatura]AGS06758.1 prolyl-tRNA synthetase [Candidatus Profftella armatura]ALC95876.1 proline--tRNA ligase [Candidatus Profftella armatura]QLK13672.1 proline--tRNA ligase [Candidatus Profftella armatura]
MRASIFFISTLKETVSGNNDVISYKLMIRSGMIKKISSGIYTYMPIGLRVIHKIQEIIRKEMNNSGSIELLMPIMQPIELWKKSGRYENINSDFIKVKDRYNRNFIIQPTSEEVITNIICNEIHSYKQLPINFYHIQTKFRDEIRPRFGLIRSREFIMKDAYSFDCDLKSMKFSYQKMYNTYIRIFKKFDLKFFIVEANNGEIGGSISHEFHVISKTGEDIIAYCPDSNYAANIETAKSMYNLKINKPTKNLKLINIPSNKSTFKKIINFLKFPLSMIIRSIVLIINTNLYTQKICILLLRSDHQLNDIKIRKINGLQNYRFASESEIINIFGVSSNYLGPLYIKPEIRIIADYSVIFMNDFACGANKINFYYTGVNWNRDLPKPEIKDIRNVTEGDLSPDGKGLLKITRGIEIGHIFQLGTIYSDKMKASYLDKNGKFKSIQMCCYGIGITRVMSAVIEQNFDNNGIIWPQSIAPFEVVLCPIGYHNNEIIKNKTNYLYNTLIEANIDVILDDRKERIGKVFADWELIGIPHRIIISNNTIKNETAEYQERRNKKTIFVPITDILKFILSKLKK